MIHHSTKYQHNSVTHFLNIHSSSIVQTVNSNMFNNTNNWHKQESGGMIQLMNDSNIIDFNSQSSPVSSSDHTIDGKSFTIAAILGLNNNNNSGRNFNEVVNLSFNQTNKLFGRLERLPHTYGTYTSTSIDRSNNASDNYQSSGLALKNLVRHYLI